MRGGGQIICAWIRLQTRIWTATSESGRLFRRVGHADLDQRRTGSRQRSQRLGLVCAVSRIGPNSNTGYCASPTSEPVDVNPIIVSTATDDHDRVWCYSSLAD